MAAIIANQNRLISNYVNMPVKPKVKRAKRPGKRVELLQNKKKKKHKNKNVVGAWSN